MNTLFIISTILISSINNGFGQISSLADELNSRLNILKFVSKFKKQNCENTGTRFTVITEEAFGRSGNNLIEFTHGLWVARQLNTTLVIPDWMLHVLNPFDTTYFDKTYCYLNLSSWQYDPDYTLYNISSANMFFAYDLFSNQYYKHLLPPLSEEVILDISKHFYQVYATLWSRPSEKILKAGLFMLSNYFQNNFYYTAVHKRQFENGCTEVLSGRTKISDFFPYELPMNNIEWTYNLRAHHPLCSMTVDFIKDIQSLHNRSNDKIYIAFDGNGDVETYLSNNFTFGFFSKKYIDLDENELKTLDKFLSIHSDLFVLNPYSTFSFEILVVRLALGLRSVPNIENNDFYLHNQKERANANNRPVWVSSHSISKSLQIEANN
jgi:hypothetical protein